MKNRNIGLILFFVFILNTNVLGVSSSTSWVVNGIPICTASGEQWMPEICSDGAGGAIITWRDSRNGAWDVYAQRVDSTGSVRWGSNGIAICDAVDHQIDPMICIDGNGGAFIVWGDKRNGLNWQIYAQRVDANGNLQWGENGIVICDQRCIVNHQILYSGNGNIIVTWADHRNDPPNPSNIFAQKIDINGNIQWETNGVPICNATSHQRRPNLCSDEEGGAIIKWDDERRMAVNDEDLYAQRINSDGVIQWDVNGVLISNANSLKDGCQLVSDKNGGAILAWGDDRNGSRENYDIYAQRISYEGIVLWEQNGNVICNVSRDQYSTPIIEDGAGGAIITWEDNRTGSNWDIYTQRIDSNGIVKWEENGVILYNADNEGDLYSSLYHESYYDGKGGIYLIYLDYRNSSSSRDVYAQKFDLDGNVQWENNGNSICNDASDQGSPKAVVTENGNIINVWSDHRNGFDSDIYAYSDGLESNLQIESYEIVIMLVINIPVVMTLIIRMRKKRRNI